MNIFGNLMRSLRSGSAGQRTWTAAEVRELIDARQLDQALAATERLAEVVDHRDAEQASLRGEIAFHQKRDEDAEVEFKRALEEVPGLPSAHYGMSLLLAARGNFEDAARHAQFAVGSHPKEPRYLAQVGYAHLCLGNYQAAENPLRRATLSTANDRYLWNNLGIVLRVKGDNAEARQCFERALALDPDYAAAREHLAQLDDESVAGSSAKSDSVSNPHTLSANVAAEFADPAYEPVLALEQAGEMQRAIAACEALLMVRPDDGAAPLLLSRLYERVGDIGSAVDVLHAFLACHADEARTAGALGLVHLRANDFQKARALLERAVEAQPDHLDFVVGLARALMGTERFAEAGPYLERACKLAPEDVSLRGLLASNLVNECRYIEAMEVIDDLTQRGATVSCTGSVLSYMGRFAEASEEFDRAVKRQPNEPGLRFERAQINLLLGNYSQGWDDYNFRSLALVRSSRMLPFPVWRGEPLTGKRIVVLAEQGLGDQIMFASCLPDLLALGPARVVVEMSERVEKTLERSFPACHFVATKQGFDLDWVKDHSDSDCFVPLADLPGMFRRGAERFPQHEGYLQADPKRVAFWRARLEAAGPAPYIGVSWKGGTELTRSPVRSLTPESLLPLATAKEATWVCLQYGEVQAAVDATQGTAMPLTYWPESIKDLDEFAALISALDLVITVCNTTVHYAGALGKPVWVLSPKIPEWRYGLHGASLPWYPSSRMFRQQVDRDWSGPIADICQELSSWSASGRATT